MSNYRPDKLPSRTPSQERLLTPDRPKRELQVGQDAFALDGNNRLMRGYVTEVAKEDGLAIMHASPDGSGMKMTSAYEATARLNPSHEMITSTMERLQKMIQDGVKGPDVSFEDVVDAVRVMKSGNMDDQTWRTLDTTIQYVLRKTLDDAGISFDRMPQHKDFDFEVAAVKAVEQSQRQLSPDQYRITLQKVQDALGHLLVASNWYAETAAAQSQSQAQSRSMAA